jgi:sulfoxide reductase catalytic subunit YedY
MWDLPQRLHTPESVYRDRKRHRREFLESMGRIALSAAPIAAALGPLAALPGCMPTPEEIDSAGAVQELPPGLAGLYPARRDERFEYGRPETDRIAAAQYTNFYEFTSGKDVYNHVRLFRPSPWSFEVSGLCAKPRTFDMDDVYREFSLEERAYRHRCVETWAMCIPWTGFPLHKLLTLVEPLAGARFVAFHTASLPEQMSALASSPGYPWPYTEGLTLPEAMNELTLLATGVYGQPLPKQHGAPVRIVVPWKYGYKSCKSLVKIELTATQPATFWNTLIPHEYDFPATVDPEIPHPRWSQSTEWMLGTNERHETVKYNGYGDYVAGLYL